MPGAVADEVPRATVAALWERARPFLVDALEHTHGTHEIVDLLDQIGQGRLQLWLGERCAAVSEILTFPRRRALNVFLAGGSLREMKAMRPGVEAFARAHACDEVMFSGRLTASAKKAIGWSRAADGYEPTHVLFVKELR